MAETELVRGRRQATPATNPAGYYLTESSRNQVLNPIHQLQENLGINWIVIDQDLVYDSTNSYFEQIRTKDGILLRFVDIFNNSKNNKRRPEDSQQLDDDLR
jgi:hypothetical protein